MKPQLNKTQLAWQQASKELGIKVVTSLVLKAESGEEYPISVHLPDYGSEKGLLLFADDEPDEAYHLAYDLGYSLCLLGVGAYEDYDRDRFMELLDDWQQASNRKKLTD